MVSAPAPAPVRIPEIFARVAGPPHDAAAQSMPGLASGAVVLEEVTTGRPGLVLPLLLLVVAGVWCLRIIRLVGMLGPTAHATPADPA